MNHPDKTNVYIAVDIAKTIHRVQSDLNGFSIKNNSEGFKALAEHAKNFDSVVVVFEATGGYERKLSDFLAEQKIPFTLVNPARVRAFANSEGAKAKTDKIDAKVLLKFAKEKKLTPITPFTKEQRKLIELMDRRAQLSEQAAREKNRLEKEPAYVSKSIERMIKCIEKEIDRIEEEIVSMFEENKQMNERFKCMCSVKGVGKVTALSILAYLSELWQVNRNKAVALAGLAPYNRDSSNTQKKRSIMGGRAKVRRCLFMAAQSAARHNPVIRDYFDGLIARGKPYRVAIVAAMRKLLLHLRTLLINLEANWENADQVG